MAHWAAPGPGPARPPVILVHGFGEHLGRYGDVICALTAAGHPVWAVDLRGHGRSDGRRADVERLDWVLADIDQLVTRAMAATGGPDHRTGGPDHREGAGKVLADPPKPVLLGHSMGGAFAAAYAVWRPGNVGALVLSAPALHVSLVHRWQGLGTQALAAIAPGVGVARIDPSQLSHDPTTVTAYVEDPLVWHGKVPARTAAVMYQAGLRAFAGARELHLPVLMVHGEDDRIVPIQSSRRFLAALGGPDKQLLAVPGSWHETHNDIGKQDVLAGLVAWLARHQTVGDRAL
jgi:alpha-beta hydrolase superfamily lysophospholipase